MRLWPICVIASTLFLSACAHFNPLDTPPAEWSNHQALVEEAPNWTARGDMVIKTPEQSERVHLYWQQTGQTTQLSLIGPLGSGRAEVLVTPQQAQLTSPDGIKTTAPTPDALLQKLRWLPLPIGAAKDWMRGLPGPATKLDWNDDGTLYRIEYEDWTIRYGTYTDSLPRYPTRVTFTHDDVRLIVTIQDWGRPS